MSPSTQPPPSGDAQSGDAQSGDVHFGDVHQSVRADGHSRVFIVGQGTLNVYGDGDHGSRTRRTTPGLWLPPRLPSFKARDHLLDDMLERLHAGVHTVIVVLHGHGGVGKTQLANEYAHRFSEHYDLAWWINAENAGLIGEQIAALAARTGLVPLGQPTPDAITAAQAHLMSTTRWLLVFDNVDSPSDIVPWLTGGAGHVLVTSRHPHWGDLTSEAIEVPVFTRSESIELLRHRLPQLTDRHAEELADAAAGLPLALAQAAGMLAETGMSAELYRQELADHAARILSHGRPENYPLSFAAAINLAVQRIAVRSEAAVQLLRMCALLGSTAVPLEYVAKAPARLLAEPLSQISRNATDLHVCAGLLAGHGIARVDSGGLTLHPLTRAVIADGMDEAERCSLLAAVSLMLVSADPGPPDLPENWPRWSQVMPHLLSLDLAQSADADVRGLACGGIHYLLAKGDIRTARPIAERLYEAWRERLGPDDPSTLTVATSLAVAWRGEGEHGRSRELNVETLERKRLVFGPDDVRCFASANNLALDLVALGNFSEAERIFRDALERSSRALGPDDAQTLATAHNLARVLIATGEYTEAGELFAGVADGWQRTIGGDKAPTMYAQVGLAVAFRRLRKDAEAADLYRQVLDQCRRVFGDDHWDTRRIASSMAAVEGNLRGRRGLESTSVHELHDAT